MRAAGFSKVKIIGQGGSPSEFQEVRSGTIEALVPFDYVGVDYQMVDSIARFYAKKPIQMTASAASIPSMRTSISSFDRSEPEAVLGGGGAVVATGAVMASRSKADEGCHKRISSPAA